MLDDSEELKPPSYSIQYPGEATEWGLASNDNKSSAKHRVPASIVWYAAAAAAGASAYFLL